MATPAEKSVHFTNNSILGAVIRPRPAAFLSGAMLGGPDASYGSRSDRLGLDRRNLISHEFEDLIHLPTSTISEPISGEFHDCLANGIPRGMGVAAIEYRPVDNIDLSQYAPGEPKSAWSKLKPSQSATLKRLVYEMSEGDVIYVKNGPAIVGKGIVTSPYQFEKKSLIQSPDGTHWQHQRQVKWMRGFPEIHLQIGIQQAVTLVRLTDQDVEKADRAIASCFAEESDIEGTKTEVRTLKTKRSRKLRDLAFKKSHGICCVCQKDFSKVLDGRGVRVLQVHHRQQLSTRDSPSKTVIGDLAVVCANCHLLLHLNPEKALSIEDLQAMLQADGFL